MMLVVIHVSETQPGTEETTTFPKQSRPPVLCTQGYTGPGKMHASETVHTYSVEHRTHRVQGIGSEHEVHMKSSAYRT